MDGFSTNSKSALLIAHPGHEVFVHGWMEIAQPVVCVLTDGTESNGFAQLEVTERIVKRAGAAMGAIFGRHEEAAVLGAVLRTDFDFFQRLTTDLASALVREKVGVVVSAATNGNSVLHDVWQGVVEGSIAIAQWYLDHPISNLQFVPDFNPPFSSFVLGDGGFRISLTDAAYRRKIEAMREYSPFAAQLDRQFVRIGTGVLQKEVLCRSSAVAAVSQFETPPMYERNFAKLLDAHRRRPVIRFRDHVEPILEAIAQFSRAA